MKAEGRVEISQAPFRQDVATVLARLRSELSGIISALPGGVSKGADLHRALKIDRTLSWKIFKVASIPDPVAAGPHVPSPGNFNTFFKAVAKRGVPDEMVERATRVVQEFQDVIKKHAGDRATFDSMVSALSDAETAEQIDLVNRRLAFRGQRHTYGVQARTQLKLAVVRTAKDPMKVDYVRVEGLVGLRQLRSDAPLVVSQAQATDDDGSPMGIVRRPLAPESGSHSTSLLKEFCSKPIPEFQEAETEQRELVCELVSKGVGKQAAITCIEGHVVENTFPRYRSESDEYSASYARVCTPCEVVIVDLVIHCDTYGMLDPSALCLSNRLSSQVVGLAHIKPRHLIPMHDRVTYLGRGPSVLHSPDVPRYPEMGQYLFDCMGWDGEQFDVYRLRIEYPVVPSEVHVAFKLPEAPED